MDIPPACFQQLISCKKGDSVFVRRMAGKNAQNIHGHGYAAFSAGFLSNSDLKRTIQF